MRQSGYMSIMKGNQGAKSWSAEQQWRRWIAMPAWQRHLILYRRDYLMVLLLIGLYLISLKVLYP